MSIYNSAFGEALMNNRWTRFPCMAMYSQGVLVTRATRGGVFWGGECEVIWK